MDGNGKSRQVDGRSLQVDGRSRKVNGGLTHQQEADTRGEGALDVGGERGGRVRPRGAVEVEQQPIAAVETLVDALGVCDAAAERRVRLVEEPRGARVVCRAAEVLAARRQRGGPWPAHRELTVQVDEAARLWRQQPLGD